MEPKIDVKIWKRNGTKNRRENLTKKWNQKSAKKFDKEVEPKIDVKIW